LWTIPSRSIGVIRGLRVFWDRQPPPRFVKGGTLRKGVFSMTIEILVKNYSMAQVEDMLHGGLISQDLYDEYYDLWHASFRFCDNP
jgi:hypothetical protein